MQHFEMMYPDREILVVDFLWQNPELPGACVFAIHNDVVSVDVNPLRYDIDVTVVVKLTAGKSAMEVIGCKPITYPACAGGFIAFRSFAEHRSIASQDEHFKMVLFLGRREDPPVKN